MWQTVNVDQFDFGVDEMENLFSSDDVDDPNPMVGRKEGEVAEEEKKDAVQEPGGDTPQYEEEKDRGDGGAVQGDAGAEQGDVVVLDAGAEQGAVVVQDAGAEHAELPQSDEHQQAKSVAPLEVQAEAGDISQSNEQSLAESVAPLEVEAGAGDAEQGDSMNVDNDQETETEIDVVPEQAGAPTSVDDGGVPQSDVEVAGVSIVEDQDVDMTTISHASNPDAGSADTVDPPRNAYDVLMKNGGKQMPTIKESTEDSSLSQFQEDEDHQTVTVPVLHTVSDDENMHSENLGDVTPQSLHSDDITPPKDRVQTPSTDQQTECDDLLQPAAKPKSLCMITVNPVVGPLIKHKIKKVENRTCSIPFFKRKCPVFVSTFTKLKKSRKDRWILYNHPIIRAGYESNKEQLGLTEKELNDPEAMDSFWKQDLGKIHSVVLFGDSKKCGKKLEPHYERAPHRDVPTAKGYNWFMSYVRRIDPPIHAQSVGFQSGLGLIDPQHELYPSLCRLDLNFDEADAVDWEKSPASASVPHSQEHSVDHPHAFNFGDNIELSDAEDDEYEEDATMGLKVPRKSVSFGSPLVQSHGSPPPDSLTPRVSSEDDEANSGQDEDGDTAHVVEDDLNGDDSHKSEDVEMQNVDDSVNNMNMTDHVVYECEQPQSADNASNVAEMENAPNEAAEDEDVEMQEENKVEESAAAPSVSPPISENSKQWQAELGRCIRYDSWDTVMAELQDTFVTHPDASNYTMSNMVRVLIVNLWHPHVRLINVHGCGLNVLIPAFYELMLKVEDMSAFQNIAGGTHLKYALGPSFKADRKWAEATYSGLSVQMPSIDNDAAEIAGHRWLNFGLNVIVELQVRRHVDMSRVLRFVAVYALSGVYQLFGARWDAMVGWIQKHRLNRLAAGILMVLVGFVLDHHLDEDILTPFFTNFVSACSANLIHWEDSIIELSWNDRPALREASMAMWNRYNLSTASNLRMLSHLIAELRGTRKRKRSELLQEESVVPASLTQSTASLLSLIPRFATLQVLDNEVLYDVEEAEKRVPDGVLGTVADLFVFVRSILTTQPQKFATVAIQDGMHRILKLLRWIAEEGPMATDDQMHFLNHLALKRLLQSTPLRVWKTWIVKANMEFVENDQLVDVIVNILRKVALPAYLDSSNADSVWMSKHAHSLAFSVPPLTPPAGISRLCDNIIDFADEWELIREQTTFHDFDHYAQKVHIIECKFLPILLCKLSTVTKLTEYALNPLIDCINPSWRSRTDEVKVNHTGIYINAVCAMTRTAARMDPQWQNVFDDVRAARGEWLYDSDFTRSRPSKQRRLLPIAAEEDTQELTMQELTLQPLESNAETIADPLPIVPENAMNAQNAVNGPGHFSGNVEYSMNVDVVQPADVSTNSASSSQSDAESPIDAERENNAESLIDAENKNDEEGHTNAHNQEPQVAAGKDELFPDKQSAMDIVSNEYKKRRAADPLRLRVPQCLDPNRSTIARIHCKVAEDDTKIVDVDDVAPLKHWGDPKRQKQIVEALGIHHFGAGGLCFDENGTISPMHDMPWPCATRLNNAEMKWTYKLRLDVFRRMDDKGDLAMDKTKCTKWLCGAQIDNTLRNMLKSNNPAADIRERGMALPFNGTHVVIHDPGYVGSMIRFTKKDDYKKNGSHICAADDLGMAYQALIISVFERAMQHIAENGNKFIWIFDPDLTDEEVLRIVMRYWGCTPCKCKMTHTATCCCECPIKDMIRSMSFMKTSKSRKKVSKDSTLSFLNSVGGASEMMRHNFKHNLMRMDRPENVTDDEWKTFGAGMGINEASMWLSMAKRMKHKHGITDVADWTLDLMKTLHEDVDMEQYLYNKQSIGHFNHAEGSRDRIWENIPPLLEMAEWQRLHSQLKCYDLARMEKDALKMAKAMMVKDSNGKEMLYRLFRRYTSVEDIPTEITERRRLLHPMESKFGLSGVTFDGVAALDFQLKFRVHGMKPMITKLCKVLGVKMDVNLPLCLDSAQEYLRRQRRRSGSTITRKVKGASKSASTHTSSKAARAVQNVERFAAAPDYMNGEQCFQMCKQFVTQHSQVADGQALWKALEADLVPLRAMSNAECRDESILLSLALNLNPNDPDSVAVTDRHPFHEEVEVIPDRLFKRLRKCVISEAMSGSCKNWEMTRETRAYHIGYATVDNKSCAIMLSVEGSRTVLFFMSWRRGMHGLSPGLFDMFGTNTMLHCCNSVRPIPMCTRTMAVMSVIWGVDLRFDPEVASKITCGYFWRCAPIVTYPIFKIKQCQAMWVLAMTTRHPFVDRQFVWNGNVRLEAAHEGSGYGPAMFGTRMAADAFTMNDIVLAHKWEESMKVFSPVKAIKGYFRRWCTQAGPWCDKLTQRGMLSAQLTKDTKSILDANENWGDADANETLALNLGIGFQELSSYFSSMMRRMSLCCTASFKYRESVNRCLNMLKEPNHMMCRADVRRFLMVDSLDWKMSATELANMLLNRGRYCVLKPYVKIAEHFEHNELYEDIADKSLVQLAMHAIDSAPTAEITVLLFSLLTHPSHKVRDMESMCVVLRDTPELVLRAIIFDVGPRMHNLTYATWRTSSVLMFARDVWGMLYQWILKFQGADPKTFWDEADLKVIAAEFASRGLHVDRIDIPSAEESGGDSSESDESMDSDTWMKGPKKMWSRHLRKSPRRGKSDKEENDSDDEDSDKESSRIHSSAPSTQQTVTQNVHSQKVSYEDNHNVHRPHHDAERQRQIAYDEHCAKTLVLQEKNKRERLHAERQRQRLIQMQRGGNAQCVLNSWESPQRAEVPKQNVDIRPQMQKV